MLRKIFFLAVVLIGCSPAKQSESANDTIPDSLLVKEYPVEVPTHVGDSVVQQAPIEIDTNYVDLVIEANPQTPQLDPTIAYVYKKSGLDLYEVNRDFKIEKVIGHLDYKAKVQLLSPLNNQMTLSLDGMKGYYALVQFENKMAYVFTGWLTSLPVPEGTSALHYYLKTVHVERARVNGDSSRWKYELERGIEVFHKIGHESHEYEITVPGMTIQQAWLLANYFMPGIDTFIKQMPTDSTLIRVHPQVYYRVETKNGKVVRISHEDNSGCYSSMSFTDVGNGIQILADAGC